MIRNSAVKFQVDHSIDVKPGASDRPKSPNRFGRKKAKAEIREIPGIFNRLIFRVNPDEFVFD